MHKSIFNWRRFWCPLDADYSLDNDGYLFDPEGEYAKYFQKAVVPFDRIAEIPCLVLLGDPGMGKSTALEHERETVEASLVGTTDKLISVDLKEYDQGSDILADTFESEEFRAWEKGAYRLHLFFDSLDESLLRIGTVANLLAGWLKRHKPPVERLRLRIACRTAEWPGVLGAALTHMFGEDKVGFYQLAPLRRQDVALAARVTDDERGFMGAVMARGAVPLAIKPVTLDFLIRTFAKSGSLPKTQAELYAEGCRLLAAETTDSRLDSGLTGKVPTEERLAIAARVAAATLLCNRSGIRADFLHDDGATMAISELIGVLPEDAQGLPVRVDEPAIDEVLGTQLFEGRLGGVRVWAHRTYAEFLAARYLTTHGVPVVQLKGLLFDPADGRAIPQLEELTAWVVGMRPDVRALVLENDPQVLLRSDVATADDEDRAALVQGLLRALDENRIDKLDWSLHDRFPKLAHPGLALQIEPFIRDKAKGLFVRRLAIDLAEECRVGAVAGALADVALDGSERYEVRRDAVAALVALDAPDEKARLRPLAEGLAGDDPEDELKGLTILGLWPAHLSAADLFRCLTPPKKQYHRRSYAKAVAEVAKHLKAEDLTIALEWVQRQPESHKVAEYWNELVCDVLHTGWEKLDQPEIMEAVAKAVWSRLKQHEAVGRHGENGRNVPLWTANDPRRLKVADQIVAIVTDTDGKAVRLVFGSTPLVFTEDIPWLLGRLKGEAAADRRRTWATVARLVFPRHQPQYVDDIIAVAGEVPELLEEFDHLLRPVDVDSMEADRLRSELRENLRWSKREPLPTAGELKPPPKENIPLWLDRFEAGDSKAWCLAARFLQLAPADTEWQRECVSNITTLPGWNEASDETRRRLVAGARVFLEKHDPETEKWFGNRANTLASLAGYRALRLLRLKDDEAFQGLNDDVWVRWGPAIFDYPCEGEDDEKVRAELLETAYRKSPDNLQKWVLTGIDKDNSRENFDHLHRYLAFIWDDRLGNALLAKAKDPALKPLVLAALLENLVEHGAKDVLVFARTLVTAPPATEDPARARALKAAEILFDNAADAGWSTIWPAITADESFGRDLWSSVAMSHRRDGGAADERLTEEQVADLYAWLVRRFPPKDDPRHDGAYSVGPREAIMAFRDGLLHYLVQRGTREAVVSLQRLSHDLPELDWLQWSTARARDVARQKSWLPPSPLQLLRLVSNAESRFVETGEQLLELIEESLHRFEVKLQSKGLSEILWDKAPEDWHAKKAGYAWLPKDEDTISRVIADHLESDIGKSGIVINREVETRKGAYTDIHVTANPKGTAGAAGDGPIRVIIEVKGCWHGKLKTAMKEQLVGKYLKESTCRHGLYLVAWFSCPLWSDRDYRKADTPKWTLVEARQEFTAQAKTLTTGDLVIKAFVVNTALRS